MALDFGLAGSERGEQVAFIPDYKGSMQAITGHGLGAASRSIRLCDFGSCHGPADRIKSAGGSGECPKLMLSCKSWGILPPKHRTQWFFHFLFLTMKYITLFTVLRAGSLGACCKKYLHDNWGLHLR